MSQRRFGCRILLRISPSSYFHVYRLFTQALSRRSIGGFRSCAWRPAFEVSSVGAWGVTAGTVKLLLPPRQSRGISLVISRGADRSSSDNLRAGPFASADRANVENEIGLRPHQALCRRGAIKKLCTLEEKLSLSLITCSGFT